MTKVGILGAQGKMGQQMIALLKAGTFPNLAFHNGFTPKTDKTYPTLNTENIQNIDVLIDFTEKNATLSYLDLFQKSKKSLVIGTTGFTQEEISRIEAISQFCPIVFAPNMSTGVNVLFDLVARASQLLPRTFSPQVLEIHHPHKKDAPSGTALKLQEEILRACSTQDDNNVPIQSFRGGDVIGEHTVFFLADGERIELTHRATNRDIFARGALQAAQWVVKQNPGFYSMKDVLENQR